MRKLMRMGNLARRIGCTRTDIDIATREEPRAHEGPRQHYHGARTRNLAHTRNLDPDEKREEPHTGGEPHAHTTNNMRNSTHVGNLCRRISWGTLHHGEPHFPVCKNTYDILLSSACFSRTQDIGFATTCDAALKWCIKNKCKCIDDLGST